MEFFSDLYCGNLVELLELNTQKMWHTPPKTGPPQRSLLSDSSTLNLQQFINYILGFLTLILVPTEVFAPVSCDSLYLTACPSSFEGPQHQLLCAFDSHLFFTKILLFHNVLHITKMKLKLRKFEQLLKFEAKPDLESRLAQLQSLCSEAPYYRAYSRFLSQALGPTRRAGSC